MDSNERLLNSMRSEGERLAERAAWLRRMIERQQGIVNNNQKTMEGFRVNLEAVELTLDGLRKEYRKLENGNDNPH